MEERGSERGSKSMKLLPSIASADPLAIGSALQALESWPYLHLDVEDGNFVPNITFGMKTVRAICKAPGDKRIQVHLMVRQPEPYLEELACCGVDSVVAHLEALDYPLSFLNRCRALGMRAGLAINIKTPIEPLNIFLGVADQVLLMTSEPDFTGNQLYEPALERVEKLVGSLPDRVELYADGGLGKEALLRLFRAGVHGAVLGRLVFQESNPLTGLQELTRFLEEGLE